MTYDHTSPDVAIPIRNVRFNQGSTSQRRWWHSEDPVQTAFYNALSCTFPAGEKFFMDSARRFRDSVDAPLRAQIKAFCGQEAVHSREHAAFNALASDSGYDVAALEDRTLKVLNIARKRSPHEQLAATCALEHFTAILAHALLADNERDMQGAPDEIGRLWAWHAMEEIEHKAVCYDTLLAATKDWSSLRRYALRTRTMVLATAILFGTIGANMATLFKADGINGPRTWLRVAGFLLGKPGVLRRIAIPYLTYFRPGFHPWQHDDRDLLAVTEARLGFGAIGAAA
ncbi:metal-dependent hydrolase [Sphingomonas sp. GB1N7]|uniref:metal-dependent hydrolase n=1 Tax=Parasphingomonas caseinilytica TaxID=3096158 RepID=UPI002FC89616